MNRHPIRFANLIDYIDDRLSPEMRKEVEAHLSSGCPICQENLAWLRHVIDAARSDDTVEPPIAAVVRAKALYRARFRRAARARRWPRFSWAPRAALTAALVLVIAVGLYASQLPSLFVRHATLTTLAGVVQRQGVHDTQWHTLEQGAHLQEGDQLRVAAGEALLTLFEGSTLNVQPGTELALSSLRSGLFGATVQIAVSQQAGSVQYDVSPLRSRRSTFVAESPTVSVSVWGTRFVLTVESVEESKVTVLEGTVQVVSSVETAVLTEREVVVVPASAPLLRLPTLTPTAVPQPDVTKHPSPLPSATPTPVRPARPATLTHTERPGEKLEPTNVPHQIRTLMPVATLEPTPTPTGTRAPSLVATIVLEKVDFVGTIEAFPNALIGRWVIGGREVHVSHHTEIAGKPAVGLRAKVRAWRRALRTLEAIFVHIEAPEPALTAGPLDTPASTRTPDPAQVIRPTPTKRPTRTAQPTQATEPGIRPTRTPVWKQTPTPAANKEASSTATPTPTAPTAWSTDE